MTGLLSASSFLLLLMPALLVVVALSMRKQASRPANMTMLLVVYVATALVPLAISTIWRLKATRIVIELRGLAFRSVGGQPLREPIVERTTGSGALLIGDTPRRRVPAATSFGTFVFRPVPNNPNVPGTLTIELPAPGARAGLVAAGGAGLVGAEPLEDGDRLCAGGACWTYDESERAFTQGDATIRIPARSTMVPGLDIPIEMAWADPSSAGTRTYSLEPFANGTRLRSFLCYARPGPRLRLVTLDPGVTLVRGGTTVTPEAAATLEDGDSIRFYSLPMEAEGFERPGIVERRSMTYRAGRQSFALELDTPEVHSLSKEQFDALVLQRGDDKKKATTVSLGMGDAQMVDRSLYFRGLSESVSLQASSLLELSRWFPRDFDSTFRIVSPRGPTDGVLARVAWIGATDLAAFRLDVLRPPLLLLLAGLLLQFFKAIAARAGRFTVNQTLFAGAVEVLIGVRLLVGYRAWSMPPHRLEAVELGLVAWMALPWMFLAASVPLAPPPRRNVRDVAMHPWAPAMAGLFFSAVFCLQAVDGQRRWIWFLCHLLAAAIALARTQVVRDFVAGAFVRGWQATTAAWGWVAGFFDRLANRRPVTLAEPVRRAIYGGLFAIAVWLLIRRFAEPSTIVISLVLWFVVGWFSPWWMRRFRDWTTPENAPYIAVAVLIFAVRFLLLMLGWKESVIRGGVRLSISAVHVPAAVVLQGFFLYQLFERARRNRRIESSDFFAVVCLLLFVWILPAALTSDIGLALLNVPVLVFLLLGLHCSIHREGRRAADFLPWVLAAGVVVFVGIAPMWRLAIPLFGNEEQMLERASDSNFARFIHFAEPERLRELATKRGESLAITSAILQRYISTGLTGRGYGQSDVSPHLGDTALRDFAPAVFIAAEWGLFGTTAMLLVYAAFFLIGQMLAPWSGSDAAVHGSPSRGTAGTILYFATATLSVTSIYMILANHELLLLTGKNAYLFGLDSAGDLLEVIALLLIAAFAAALFRDEAPETAQTTSVQKAATQKPAVRDARI
ncbi:MAG TPA: hypothetical protein VNI54_02970 [Thermoanaerobaculia bacterium]|nr:hypothetical protein [Thermoanaerobaculia bacterium]